MGSHDALTWKYHEDSDLFRAALTYTEAITGFSARLIEKDYYCSIILHDMLALFGLGMVFKGGTCLSKVYTAFYRMSEDLDFVMPTEIDAPRAVRRKKFVPLNNHLASLPGRVPCFHEVEPLQGANLSKQYAGRYGYRSLVSGQDEFIKVEIGLREPLLDPVEQQQSRTMLMDPFRYEPAIVPALVNVMSLHETYAEKFRAALTRREPAIRDFYDIAHAVRTSTVVPDEARFVELVQKKLSVPGNEPIDISAKKLTTLQRQLASQLKPVLRAKDYDDFDLQQAFGIVTRLAKMIAE
jgi:predicted nucleotidyltransferase component of viral defense system